MRWFAAGLSVLWFFIAAARFVADQEAHIAAAAGLGWGMAAFAEWQLAQSQETVRRLARLARGGVR